jgi:LacI family transcriptional regulator
MKVEIVTIKDIARELGISKSTVSRALHNSTDINADTKKRVIETAERLNYVPNPMAVSLLKSRSYSIGVIVPDISNPFFSLIFASIDNAAYDRGYHVMLFQSHDSIERERTIVRHAYNQRLDGLIVSLAGQTDETEHFEQLYQKGFPLVFFDRIPNEMDAPSISVDDFEGAYLATQHLIEQGCRRIAHIGGPTNLTISRRRLQGFRTALLEHNIPIINELTVSGSYNIEEGMRLTGQLLDQPNRPDGIFAASDRIGFGAHRAIRERGLSMPQDVALIGFSDLPMDLLLDPPLSSMAQPVLEMGKVAVDMMIDIMSNEALRSRPIRHVLKTTLMARGSSVRTKKP